MIHIVPATVGEDIEKFTEGSSLGVEVFEHPFIGDFLDVAMHKMQPAALHQGFDHGTLQLKRSLLYRCEQYPTKQEYGDRGPPVKLLLVDQRARRGIHRIGQDASRIAFAAKPFHLFEAYVFPRSNGKCAVLGMKEHFLRRRSATARQASCCLEGWSNRTYY